jgi:hypothetical protein
MLRSYNTLRLSYYSMIFPGKLLRTMSVCKLSGRRSIISSLAQTECLLPASKLPWQEEDDSSAKNKDYLVDTILFMHSWRMTV